MTARNQIIGWKQIERFGSRSKIVALARLGFVRIDRNAMGMPVILEDELRIALSIDNDAEHFLLGRGLRRGRGRVSRVEALAAWLAAHPTFELPAARPTRRVAAQQRELF